MRRIVFCLLSMGACCVLHAALCVFSVVQVVRCMLHGARDMLHGLRRLTMVTASIRSDVWTSRRGPGRIG